MSPPTRISSYFIASRCAILAFYLALGCIPVQAQEVSADEFFETRIRPMLADHCFECHGVEKQWNALRLDSREAILQGGDSGPAIIAGHPEQSLLFHAVSRTGELQMPPDDPLNEEQIDALRQWIAIGAPWPNSVQAVERQTDAWKNHWAFQPIRSPEVPCLSQPSIDSHLDHPCLSDRFLHPIDAFVMSGLVSNGLEPSPGADRRTLIRRLTFDLTGLPPTNDEVQLFLHDERPDAYERLVDRLLSSPSYGEQFARNWLDVARYSDTKGYVYAREERFFVHAAMYRQWVVSALNSDMPYDDFIRLQIAADQVAPGDIESLRAMGFLTLGRRFLGVMHDIIDDRIDVVGRGTMGLTIACARCHDHKYDPIPTSDYYSLYGVFHSSTERQVELNASASASDGRSDFEKELESRKAKLAEKLSSSRKEASDRVRQRVADYLYAQSELEKYPEEGFDVVLSTTDIIPAFVRRWESYLARLDRSNDPVFGPWFQLSGLTPAEFAEQVDGCLSSIRSRATVHPWVEELFATKPSNLREVADRYGKLFSSVDETWKKQTLDSALRSEADEAWLESSALLREVLYGPKAPCEVPDEEVVSTEFFFDSGTCVALWSLQGEVDRWRLQAPESPRMAVGLFDRATLTEPRIFKRGNPRTKGDRISRHFLSLFSVDPAEPFQTGSGRRELAEKIVDPKNPLTARVWVNRIWQHHFGEGLVRTASDFGLRADPPSHPELLDWLATLLIESKWSTKAIHRAIVLSSTYQQSSGVENPVRVAKNMQVDPDNRLLWRTVPRRLRFEELRDGLLSVSGELECGPAKKTTEMIAGGAANHRRSLYGLVDRQFLPGTLRIFDFANPDLHIARRSETSVPQQALYFMNHPFVAERAKAVAWRAKRVSGESANPHERRSPTQEIDQLYLDIFQRKPTGEESQRAIEFLSIPESEAEAPPPAETFDWSYGYGEVDEVAGRTKNFEKLPHFTGKAWQGGPAFPDGPLGWLQLTATGGHPGNDRQHACIRRWTAPKKMSISVESMARHEHEVGDGVRFRILSSRHGILQSHSLRATQGEMNIDRLEIEAGDTLDFVVDILEELNTDQHLWAPSIRELVIEPSIGNEPANSIQSLQHWDAERDFRGPKSLILNRLEQLAQVLLLTNEFMFID